MVVQADPQVLNRVREMFRSLESPVKLRFVRPRAGCQYCDDIEYVLTTLAGLSDKVSVEVLSEDAPEAEKYELPMYPAVLVHGAEEYNIRFFGLPAGYEFGALVEDIIDVSRGKPSLNPVLEKVLREKVRKRVRIMVFVTPTCPYCPIAVRAAHKAAMANPLICGDMIEAIEFPELADKYNVFTVPKSIIQVEGKDVVEIEGAYPDAFLVAEILKAVGEEVPGEIIRELPEGQGRT